MCALSPMQVVPAGDGFILAREAAREFVPISRAEAEAIAAAIVRIEPPRFDLSAQLRRFGADSLLPDWKPPTAVPSVAPPG